MDDPDSVVTRNHKTVLDEYDSNLLHNGKSLSSNDVIRIVRIALPLSMGFNRLTQFESVQFNLTHGHYETNSPEWEADLMTIKQFLTDTFGPSMIEKRDVSQIQGWQDYNYILHPNAHWAFMTGRIYCREERILSTLRLVYG